MMTLDECPANSLTQSEAAASASLTLRWAERAKAAWTGERGALFGICQGGMYASLRRESASIFGTLHFPGYGIGGLGIGEPKDVFTEMLIASASSLPPMKPRYLMGIGAPEDLVNGVAAGVDMFDCVLQTREARNGSLLTSTGRLNVTNAAFARDPDPIASDCDCETCRTYSRAYLHHLFRSRELLGYRLATIHNLRWTMNLLSAMQGAIQSGSFAQFRRTFLASYVSSRRSLPS